MNVLSKVVAQETNMRTNSIRSLTLLILGIIAALCVADLAMRLYHDQPAKLQVRDGLKDLQRVPDVLVISSSHGRSFHVLGDVLRERTDGKVDLIAVALEAGKVDAMEWVLHNRVKPLITDKEGSIKPPLTHVMFGITWWDTCREEVPTQTANNVVTHGWQVTDYLEDFAKSGANELNRNYVRNLWRYLFSHSALVKTRFVIKENFGRFTNFLRIAMRGEVPESEYQERLDRWHNDIDNGHDCYLSEMDMQGLNRFTQFTSQHDLDFTIVLFPLKPETITEVGLTSTIKPFAKAMKAYGAKNDVRVIDMTLGIVDDSEFMLDFDHINPEGNIKWSEYALDNDLQFLLEIDSAGVVR